ncbi:MAG: NUDIX domain-containing protein [Rhodospirillaceae bacterium]|nr:NUDIX domain-containing protein [Rhodospirillaceae bacterium]MYH35856.1 NUDIX domain-containing protein [Rhodospirillaceae bacterium]
MGPRFALRQVEPRRQPGVLRALELDPFGPACPGRTCPGLVRHGLTPCALPLPIDGIWLPARRSPQIFPKQGFTLLSGRHIRPGRKAELLARKTGWHGYFRLDLLTLRHTRHDGSMSPALEREMFERGHAAGVLPYDPARDEVLLIEQFRPGPLAAGDPDPWQIEIVAGMIDKDGETAEDVVRREAMEEAGIEIGDLEPIAEIYTTPGACTERIALFCGRCDLAGAGGIFGLAGEDEDIRAFPCSMEEIREALARRAIRNAITVVALQWLCLNRARLRTIW